MKTKKYLVAAHKTDKGYIPLATYQYLRDAISHIREVGCGYIYNCDTKKERQYNNVR